MAEQLKDEHLTVERVSALLDEPCADLAAEEHLERCASCREEFERLSRMRMALSALGDLAPPADEWSRIEARLDRARPEASGIGRLRAGRLLTSLPLQAAAAIALFAGGVLVGLEFTGSVPADDAAGAPDGTSDPALPAVISTSGEDRAVLEVLSELESLQAPLRQVGLDEESAGRFGPGGAGGVDGMQAIRLAARIDGLIRAAQDRLERSPDDAVASALLLDLVEQRERLAEVVERSFQQARTVEW